MEIAAAGVKQTKWSSIKVHSWSQTRLIRFDQSIEGPRKTEPSRIFILDEARRIRRYGVEGQPLF